MLMSNKPSKQYDVSSGRVVLRLAAHPIFLEMGSSMSSVLTLSMWPHPGQQDVESLQRRGASGGGKMCALCRML